MDTLSSQKDFKIRPKSETARIRHTKNDLPSLKHTVQWITQ